MRLFIDGDAFPNLLKPIVVRVLKRLNLEAVVVSNKKISLGETEGVRYIIVEQGADEADKKIIEMVESGDLVITADIPLADHVISKQAHAIDHRGALYSKDNIKHYLAVRDLMETIRESGEMTKGPKPFGPKDAHNFANQLDRFVTKHAKNLK